MIESFLFLAALSAPVDIPFHVLDSNLWLEEPVLELVRSPEDWAGLFERFSVPTEMGMREYPPRSPGPVDFGSEMLVVIGLGRVDRIGPELCARVWVDSVTLEGDSLYVYFSETTVESGQYLMLGEFVYPSCLAVLERVDASPVFVPSTPHPET
jgi:hypothetical protein